jgi:hypothetical protein
LLQVAILAIINIRQYVIHVHPAIIAQIESINIYVQLIKVHQVEDIAAVLSVLLDIIRRMLDQINAHCVQKRSFSKEILFN